MAKIGTWDDVMGSASAEVQAVAVALRAAIKDRHPDVFEEARVGDKAVTYGWGPKKMLEGYAYLMPQKDRVNLGFYYGALLPDPDGLLDGTGKSLRHVKVRLPQITNAISALIDAARLERKEGLGIN